MTTAVHPIDHLLRYSPYLAFILFLLPFLSPAQKPELVVRQEAHIGYPTVTAFSSDGHYLLSGGDDRRLVLWDIPSGNFIRRAECIAKPLALRFDTTNVTATALLADHSVMQWGLNTRQQKMLLPLFIRNVFLEENAYDDVLGLAQQFEGYLQNISAKSAEARLFRGQAPLGDIRASGNTGQISSLVEETIGQARMIIDRR